MVALGTFALSVHGFSFVSRLTVDFGLKATIFSFDVKIKEWDAIVDADV